MENDEKVEEQVAAAPEEAPSYWDEGAMRDGEMVRMSVYMDTDGKIKMAFVAQIAGYPVSTVAEAARGARMVGLDARNTIMDELRAQFQAGLLKRTN